MLKYTNRIFTVTKGYYNFIKFKVVVVDKRKQILNGNFNFVNSCFLCRFFPAAKLSTLKNKAQ